MNLIELIKACAYLTYISHWCTISNLKFSQLWSYFIWNISETSEFCFTLSQTAYREYFLQFRKKSVSGCTLESFIWDQKKQIGDKFKWDMVFPQCVKIRKINAHIKLSNIFFLIMFFYLSPYAISKWIGHEDWGSLI